MKKLLLTGAMLMALSFNAKAQETLLETTFGTNDDELNEQIENYANIDLDEDGDFWGYYLDEDFEALGFEGILVGSASFLVDENEELVLTTPQNLFVTPILDLTDYVSSTLTYKVGGLMGTTAVMNYQLIVLDQEQIEDENLDLTTLEPVYSGEITGTTDAEDITFDLTEYTGQAIAVIFVHTESTGAGYLLLDDIVVTASDVAGVDTVISSGISVYPNPTSSVLNVANAGLVSNVSITDINGRTVKSVKFNGVSDAQVNISDLSAGVYMMNISSDKGTTVKKIVKN